MRVGGEAHKQNAKKDKWRYQIKRVTQAAPPGKQG